MNKMTNSNTGRKNIWLFYKEMKFKYGFHSNSPSDQYCYYYCIASGTIASCHGFHVLCERGNVVE